MSAEPKRAFTEPTITEEASLADVTLQTAWRDEDDQGEDESWSRRHLRTNR